MTLKSLNFRVDVFESTLRHNEELTPEEKAIIESNLESLNVEIASIQDSAQSILKTIRKQGTVLLFT